LAPRQPLSRLDRPVAHLPSSENATRHATLKTYIYAPKATLGVFRTSKEKKKKLKQKNRKYQDKNIFRLPFLAISGSCSGQWLLNQRI